MARIATATTGLVGKVNRTVIVELLREKGPMSRTGLAEVSGLSPATVNRLVSNLMQQGLLVFDSQAPSTGGRPPSLIRYNARLESVIVVDVGATETRGAIADLSADFIAQLSHATDVADLGSGGASVVEDVRRFIAGLIANATDRALRPKAIAIAAPGVVRPGGIVEWAPTLGWRELPLGELIEAQTGLPTFVENDLNLLALGEHRCGAGAGTHTMVALGIEAGLGGGLIIEDQLYRGTNSAAGEIGYLLTGRDALDRVYPGFGDLEGRVAGAALTRRAAEIGLVGPSRAATIRQLFTAAEAGDQKAREIVDDLLDLLALTIGNISSILDPELIVIGGSMVQGLGRVTDAVSARLIGRIPHPPRIEPSLLGPDAVLAGGATLALEHTADYAFVRAPTRETRQLARRGRSRA